MRHAQSMKARMTPTDPSPVHQGVTPRLKPLKRDHSETLVRTTQEGPLSKGI